MVTVDDIINAQKEVHKHIAALDVHAARNASYARDTLVRRYERATGKKVDLSVRADGTIEVLTRGPDKTN